MLTQIFTPEKCATCKLCCNFERSSAWETPYLDDDTLTTLQRLNVPLCAKPDGSMGVALQFHSHHPQETCNCPLLDPHKGCTLPREMRPFECRVWPLRMMYDEKGKICLACYKHCPALSEPDKMNLLIQYAHETLLPLMRQYAHTYPKSIRPFHPRYYIIWRE